MAAALFRLNWCLTDPGSILTHLLLPSLIGAQERRLNGISVEPMAGLP